MIFLTLEEIKQQPAKTMFRLYEFLGVNPHFIPSNVKGKANPAQQLRFPIVNRITRITTEVLADLNLSSWANYLKNTTVYRKFKKINSKLRIEVYQINK